MIKYINYNILLDTIYDRIASFNMLSKCIIKIITTQQDINIDEMIYNLYQTETKEELENIKSKELTPKFVK